MDCTEKEDDEEEDLTKLTYMELLKKHDVFAYATLARSYPSLLKIDKIRFNDYFTGKMKQAKGLCVISAVNHHIGEAFF
jgi:hypothetical protein